jgi:urate oxidase / 2-oxo-4-hydroxy-4-carboxy-5-ureidoimidazoline decarboxylase
MHSNIYYGKGNIALYRSYATPLTGITPIPESPYVGQSNTIFGVDLDVEVFGDVFMPAYTEGDNSKVVPTATITNFAFKKALDFTGATRENFLYYLAQQYLAQYPDMESVRLTAKELPFLNQALTDDAGKTSTASDRLLAPAHDSYGYAQITMNRNGIISHECGLYNNKLIKLTGNAFANFPRDEFTTLPDRIDRPLYIYMDMGWRYGDVQDGISDTYSRYIPSQQVYDHITHTFHDFLNMSIQHLVYEMGVRLLRRFPQMGEVWFKAQNRLWDTAAETPDSTAKVYMDPRPPYGMIGLTLSRSDVE